MPKKGGSSDQLGFFYPISGSKNSCQVTTGSQHFGKSSSKDTISSTDALCDDEESVAFLIEQLSKSGILDVKKRR